MFTINSLLIILTSVFLKINFVSSKCVNIPTSDYQSTIQISYVECKNVRSMHDLAADMRSNWHRLKIVNKMDSVFTNAEHQNPFLQYIQHLDLSEVGTLHMSDYGFRDFSQLIQLNISNTRTLALKHYWFSKHNSVQVLDISWNKLSVLRREDFRTLSSLVTVDFSHNAIENIETLAFSGLKKLKVLDLRNNQLNHLIEWGELLNMEVLNLDDNHLTKLPSDGFRTLNKLHTLTVSQNSLNDLEKNWWNGLRQLQKLNLSGNHIQVIEKHLFREFSGVQMDLNELDLNNNNISILPSNAFENLNYLQILDLSENSIKNIHEHTFSGLNSLRKLFLNNNDILNIQQKSFAHVEKLDSLDLSENSLQSFSGDIFGTSPSSPSKLRKLFLRGNRLVAIQPNTFDVIPNLDFLVLTDNEIIEMDDGLLLPLTKLKKLHLNRNKIRELSGMLFNTTKLLQELYMDHNKLTFFPDVTNDFSNMLKLSVEGNPWQCACFREIIDWATRRGINYSPYVSKKYYDGSRPICVVTQVNNCVKDVDFAKKQHIVEIYEAAFN